MKKLSFTLLVLALFAVRCSGDLPLSDLMNNTVTLKMLGTYESNDGYNFGTDPKFGTLYKDDIITGTQITNANPALTGASLNIIDYANNQVTISRLKYYIDIAEIRIAEGQGKSSSQSISDYWSQLAITRQLMCSDYSTADENRILSNCSDSNGVQRLYDFFNGGFTYPAVDVANGNYNHMGIYFRRFATYPAAFFTGAGNYSDGTITGTTTNISNMTAAEKVRVTVFDNRSIYAQDVENLLQLKYGQDSSAEPLMFPLQRKDLSLRVTNGAEPYVMEVRVFLRNLMMVHAKQVSGNTNVPAEATNSALVYVAPSDWNINHAYQDTANFDKQGGAVLMTARVYQPSKVGSIKMTTAGTAGHYFVAHPADLVFDPTTTLPLAATAATNTTISNLAPGSYNVYRTCDLKICSIASTAGSCDNAGGTDGFPETAKLCGTVNVTANTQSGVTTCSCP